MNQYVKHLNRIEFVVTYACTGSCKHCSEGEHSRSGVHIDADAAAGVVRDLAGQYGITSVMTFGGEPLLCILRGWWERGTRTHTTAEPPKYSQNLSQWGLPNPTGITFSPLGMHATI